MAVLPFIPDRVCPSFCPEFFDIESHAKPAAFDDAGGALNLPAEDLGDFEGFLPSFVRKVVNMARPFLSGLGVREVFFWGTDKVGGEYGLGRGSVLNKALLLERSVGESEAVFDTAGRCGRGGPLTE